MERLSGRAETIFHDHDEVNDHRSSIRFKKNVILAYKDISAAGCRALLGVDMRVEYESLDLPDISSLRPACVRDCEPSPTEQHFKSVQILNHKYEQFTLVVVNTDLPGERCHYVVGRIMDHCVSSGVKLLVVLSALRLEIPASEKREIYGVVCINAKENITFHEPLPEDTLVCDPVLSTVLQMALVEQIPTHVLIIPAHKARLGYPNKEDGSLQNIALFHETLDFLFRLKFDTKLSNSLLYKGKNLPDGDSPMIYV